MDAYESGLGPLIRLRERIDAVLAEHGLDSWHVAYCLGSDITGPHELQIIVGLPEGWGRTELDDSFDDVIAGAHQADVEAKAAARTDQLHTELQRRLEEGEGIL